MVMLVADRVDSFDAVLEGRDQEDTPFIRATVQTSVWPLEGETHDAVMEDVQDDGSTSSLLGTKELFSEVPIRVVTVSCSR